MKNERIFEISNTLKDLGISPALQGYTYLREALELVMDNSELAYRGGITKILYPTIAKKYKNTIGGIERSIRYAIEIAFDRTGSDLLEKMFGCSTDACKGKATNSEFIATIADYLLLRERENEQR